MRPGLLMTGTDTGVGKTRIASAIAHGLTHTLGLRVGVLKPVATGVAPGEAPEDAVRLAEAVGLGSDLIEHVTPLAFAAPLAPPIAAREEGATLHHADVLRRTSEALAWWEERGVDLMIVEGVGGFLCPLGEDSTVADLAIDLDLPVVIVARRGLGTINHTLLTVEAALHRGVRVAGVVLNGAPGWLVAGEDPSEASNALELALRLPDGVAVLADVPTLKPDPSGVVLLWDRLRDVDWYGLARPSRRRISE